MPNKYQLVNEMANETLKDITSSSENWIKFLNTASNNYKYSFNEQVLIYAQKPDATACADIETWNKRLKRWVNRGAKGIALISIENGRNVLRHVFDISDTHSGINQELKLWEVKPSYENGLIETLENSFGNLEIKDNLAEAIYSSSFNLVEDNFQDYLVDLKEVTENTTLQKLTDSELESFFKGILVNSVAYMTMNRCNIDPMEHFSLSDFDLITQFANKRLISRLGAATSDIAEQELREIYSSVRNFEKSTNYINRTFVNNQKSNYHIDENKNIEGRNKYDRSNIPTNGRLSNTTSSITKNKENDTREIFKNEGEISKGTQKRTIRGINARWQSGRTFRRDRRNSSKEIKANYQEPSREEQSERTNETDRPNGMGSRNELNQEPGRRNGNDGTNLQLNLFTNTYISPIKSLPSVETQINNIQAQAEVENTSAFSFTQEVIDNVLLDGSHVVNGKFRIYRLFQESYSTEDNIAFLKKEYGEGGSGVRNYENLDEWHNAKGIKLTFGLKENAPELLLTWSKVEKRLKELVNADIYLNSNEKEKYQKWLNEEYESEKWMYDARINPEKEQVISQDEKQDVQKEQSTTPISIQEKINYHIENNLLGEGTPKEKVKRNIDAIKLLKRLEEENRLANKEEQEVLAQYIGWGGLPDVFDENKTNWSEEYHELKELLTDDEYKSARASTLTAFYTPPIVINAIYKTLKNMGLEQANILEPSCGVGNFLGMLPEEMQNSKLYGIELDSISGKIAKQLYQKADIRVEGYEKANLPDSFFDVAIGNVPFGDFKVNDSRYNKNNFLIHDYFFAKTLDKVRPGGIIAFVTSKGTMDKANPEVRKYIAQRADLLGAIRLPDNAFTKNAGTKVTSDIIFLQKRENLTDIMPDWVYLNKDENDISMNTYFIDKPEMILGNMEIVSTAYGYDSTCKADESQSLEEQLDYAITNIHGELQESVIENEIEQEDTSIPAIPSVKNFSYAIVDDKIYFRENSRMILQEDLPLTNQNRIKGLIALREQTRELIDFQLEDRSEEYIHIARAKLNEIYDRFTKEYGLINSRANENAFSNDSSYFLLCSLEKLDSEGKFIGKADIFSKRTIKAKKQILKVDTPDEALILSIQDKAKVDLNYMQKLCGIDMDKMVKSLEGVIFNVPEYGEPDHWVTADEYLSGNVREKLKIAEEFAKEDPSYNINVEKLKEVIPEDLTASEIGVKLGSTWIPPEIIRQFIFELLETPRYKTWDIHVKYSNITAEWYIDGKSEDRDNVKAYSTYGTPRINAYKIIEQTLNLKDVKVYDTIIDDEGKKKRVLNRKETAIASSKQDTIKEAFLNWIWNEPERRNKLVRLYNDKFNSVRPREYDGSHIDFVGMNPEIKLRPHQLNAVAHVLYGKNVLLAHEVGAGKTYEMVAAAMESKRLGLCNKSLVVVPNHIIEQFASEFLQLYPSANILVATKKDFETKNRKKFCSRIATGDFDAVIIGHSQFEKIPMSVARQISLLEAQINDITNGIAEEKAKKGEYYTIKQLEKTKRGLESRLAKLNKQERKDDVVTFEELGIDKLFVDEAHNYKNLFLYTKMRNVGGIAQTEAQKSTDLFMKCRYLDEITGGKGTVFATGTPVSNSMAELYTMQRYLQYDDLKKNDLEHFDNWASTFGETITAIELNVMKMFDRKNKAEYQKVA
jgi:N12 class adenine-specific DNA methylase